MPKITIITPTYNQGQYLEGMIESVLAQQYPNLEFIVVDGGSTDQSVEIIRHYQDRINWWVSEPDDGQSDAINKGFARATGEVVNWLCSDDRLAPGALAKVGSIFAERCEIDVVAGKTQTCVLETGGQRIAGPTREDVMSIPYGCRVQQPSCFFRRKLLRSDLVKSQLHYTMDVELWVYLQSRGAKWLTIDEVLATEISWGANKNSVAGLAAWREWLEIHREYCRDTRCLTWALGKICTPLVVRARGTKGIRSSMYWRATGLVNSLLAARYGRAAREMFDILGWLSANESIQNRAS